MIYTVPDDDNTLAIADTKEEAIARLRQMQQWGSADPDAVIMVQRKHAPLWFGHLVQNTVFEFLAYYKHQH